MPAAPLPPSLPPSLRPSGPDAPASNTPIPLHPNDFFRQQASFRGYQQPQPEPRPELPLPANPMVLPLLFIAINVAVWLWNVFSGVHAFAPKTADLESWGGNTAILTLTDEPWRLLTSMFLHAGAMHLFFNMYFLFQIGPLLVLRKGHAGFAVVYMCGGLLASASSAWWQAHNLFADGASLVAYNLPRLKLIVSVGASGAIMAVAGALACNLVLAQRRARSGRGGTHGSVAEKQLMQSLLQVIGVNVAMGFFIPGLDQAAHLGGLLSGALLACVLPAATDRLPASARWLRVLAAVGISAVLLLGVWTLAANAPQMRQVKEQLAR